MRACDREEAPVSPIKLPCKFKKVREEYQEREEATSSSMWLKLKSK